MIKNYFKIALRNLKKNKLYTTINIFGLSIGLAACLLILLYVSSELTYDSFHEKSTNIVRATMEYKASNEVNYAAVTGTKVGPEFSRRIPSVEDYVRTYISSGNIIYKDKSFAENRILFADPSFFNIFSFQLVQGNAANVLDASNKIVLTESMAKKYFGMVNPVNQVINAFGRDFIVSGVCKDVPKNSQIKFDFVTQFLNLNNNVKREQWWSANWITYLLLNDTAEIAKVEQQVNEYMSTDLVRKEARLNEGEYLKYNLEPLLDVHLKSELAGFEPNGSLTYIYVFVIITVLILMIAIANYTNLATAQSTTRSAEIGVRKVMGASKKQVFFQFISEATTITIISTIIALGISVLFIPYFNNITGQSFTRMELLQPIPVFLLLLFSTIVSVLAGLYPALILSNSKVISILKEGFRSTGGNNLLRKSLIVGQFAISVFLIIFTLIIIQQMNYVQSKDLGYDKDHVVVLPIRGNMLNNFSSIKEAFEQVEGVKSVTASYETPEFVNWSDGIHAADENGEHDISVNAMPIDLDFIKTMGMELVAGRDFITTDFALMDTINTDNKEYRQPYLINETLAKRIGWSPDEAIGRTISNRADGPILGVVKDFHFSSLHDPIGPLLFFLNRNFSRNYIVRISGADVKNTLTSLESTWMSRISDKPFDYHFLDQDYDALYESEKRSSLLFSVAAGLSVLLACLGLFGLVAFSIVQRTKEIGIRKVLGANLGNIMLLVSKNFLILVVIAVAIASPFAYWASKNWLQDFTYRIEPQLQIFVIAGLVTVIVTMITISYHSLKAANANPVNALRSE
ncbi:ABC transporter permease [Winogradskyella haliclonae]|uniref:ABC transporter permease n=1 Tax=Winogradskyella haliclonae TaxID=2048558 RepID=A0ABQ2BWT2_9FLAO|nr:ABC transporter permease [Winogradskyella haliclonae]GGI56905.1 ABC transporter permease [Winogradskyella haliclonae]